MVIRPTEPSDINEVMAVYDTARRFMQQNGNPNQWIDGYPSREFISQEIKSGYSYVIVDEYNNITAVFSFIIGNDITYDKIDNGEWLNNLPYGTIHRIASSGTTGGITKMCIDWCFNKHNNIRIDTHPDNIPMQKILLKEGFSQCGIIYVANGTSRLAFQKTIVSLPA